MELNVTSEEYKNKFMSTIVEVAKIEPNDMWIVFNEYEAHAESVGEEYVGNPEIDAKECMSYWTE